jgi:tetratricopeptide (TPR) repeat protein/transcriptional regulator with XRE-family HTH domain
MLLLGAPVASFGQLLRQLRLIVGLTQEELARAAGISARSVSDLERGVNLTARKETARLLADALDLTGSEREMFEALARGRFPGGGVVAATRTLPRDISFFTGREKELHVILAAAAGGGLMRVCAIGGMAGVGKTTLAIHAAHLLTPSFPDGQIFLHLHSHTLGRTPVAPADALASLLQTTGVAAPNIPTGLEARASLWRDRLAGKRMLIVLDDAVGSEQVRALLPGSPECLVLVTSRRHISALEDCHVISIDSLQVDQAAQLIARLADRSDIGPDDEAVAQIARLCGCLPLALGMLARQLHHHSAWSAPGLAADLTAARNRLELMHAEEVSVAAAFDLSNEDLTQDQRRLFRRLGLHFGADIDVYAAASLDDASLAHTRRNLEALFDRYLLSEPTRGRYRMHDLVREHARVLSMADSAAERDAAVSRLLDYYLHTARDADRYLARHTSSGVPPVASPPPVPGPEFTSRGDAVFWMDAERLNLHGAAEFGARHDRPSYAIAISAAMHGFMRSQGHWEQSLTLHRTVLQAARDASDKLAEASVLTDLGAIQRLLGDFPTARASLTRAIDLYRDAGDHLGEANALNYLGIVQYSSGDSLAAGETQERALTLYQDVGNPLGEANALNRLGIVQGLTGRFAAAIHSQQTALGIYRDLRDRVGEADCLKNLGAVQCLTEDYLAAAHSQQDALKLYRDLSHRVGEASTLISLGAVQQALGDYSAAASSFSRALELDQDLGNRHGQAQALNNIGELALARGRQGDALEHFKMARSIAENISALGDEARAIEGIGQCHLQNGQPEQGTELLRAALAIYQRIGSPRAQRVEDKLCAQGWLPSANQVGRAS